MKSVVRAGRVLYNRSKELNGLKNMSGQGGSMVLITGPPDSGKSTLLSDFMSCENHISPIHIDMRSGTYNTAASFSRELKAQTMRQYVPSVMASLVEKASLTPSVVTSLNALEETREADMQGLLKALAGLFRLVAPEKRVPYPTIIIDEANELLRWSPDASEVASLRSLQAWLLMVTKQMDAANLILCSSDDSFPSWVDSHFGKYSFRVGYVGDLTEKDAFSFFKQQLSVKDLPVELWKEIYDYVGGSINLLKHVAKRISWEAGDNEAALKAAWANERSVLHATSSSRIDDGMHPEVLPLIKWIDPQRVGVSPVWTPDEFKWLLRQMTAAEGGVCSFNELCQHGIRSEAIFSLIQHNFLHYRQASLWGGGDLDWYKGPYPVVMPIDRPDFHAMKEVLEH